MKLSPVAGIRILPICKVRPAEPELTVEFHIESPPSAADDNYSEEDKNSAGAEGLQGEAENSEESIIPGEETQISIFV